MSPVNSLLPGIPFLLLGESCSPSLDPPGQFLGGNSHPWGISVTFQNTKNHVHSIVLSWLKGQYWIEICYPKQHLSSPTPPTFAAHIVGWLLVVVLSSAAHFCCHPPSIDRGLAGFFVPQSLTTAIRCSCHQSPPTFAAPIVGWLFCHCPLPAVVVAQCHAIMDALITGHFCHCC